jgi:hypothetical protein
VKDMVLHMLIQMLRTNLKRLAVMGKSSRRKTIIGDSNLVMKSPNLS